jgi:hypothetical protein
MSDQPLWPSLPDGLPSKPGEPSVHDRALLALFQAQLQDIASHRATNRSHSDSVGLAIQAQLEVEDRRRDAFLSAYLAVAQATLDRMLKRAETLATVVVAVATIYGSILGVAFSIKDGAPLPWIGLVPAVILGASLVCVAVYLGSTNKGEMTGRALAAGSGPRADQKRLNTFVEWVNSVALNRACALNASVILLAVGIMCFPLPFIFHS